ncbi:hypothetical protein JQS43_25035 [Natronosporangium hydrolyticum]|uniref:Uncharacterized protein n=1 Tax=Natronosporangium hydrolyticum TaxID=2811111 RepID=A0A895YH18_9ACTN|nr:hypothetical protein [Natronosporangium hydrolyticum]QSB14683.1 hypothetical protein JQS43_25035 [Natronosporangium hydrolyticum]
MTAVFNAWPLGAAGGPGQPVEPGQPVDPPAELGGDDPEPLPEGYEPI